MTTKNTKKVQLYIYFFGAFGAIELFTIYMLVFIKKITAPNRQKIWGRLGAFGAQHKPPKWAWKWPEKAVFALKAAFLPKSLGQFGRFWGVKPPNAPKFQPGQFS
jgi:hypothetical protein